MRPLILTPESTADARRLLAHAEANVLSWDEIQARATGAIDTPLGSQPEFRCVIPMGYRCVFCFEMQRTVKYRYLSVSVGTPGKYPNEIAMDEIAKIFGFKNSYRSGRVLINVDKPTQCVMFREPVE